MDRSNAIVFDLETLNAENASLSRFLETIQNELATLESLSFALCEHLRSSLPQQDVSDCIDSQTVSCDIAPFLRVTCLNMRLREKLRYCHYTVEEIESKLLSLSDILGKP